MAAQVLSGDSNNREGVAANVFFEALFGDGFVRLRQDEVNSEPPPWTRKNGSCPSGLGVGHRADPDPTTYLIANAMLNYGYAVLRAAVARAVVMAGLHPALGIHHRHRENTFSLADDLIEPLRCLVDRRVLEILLAENDLPDKLTPHLKRCVLQILTADVVWDGGLWPLDAALEAYAAGVRSCLLGEKKVLVVPGA